MRRGAATEAGRETAPRVADLARDAQVVAHRQVGEQLEPLERARDPEPGPLVRVEPAHVAAVEQDPARRRREHAGDDVEQRGLARAVGPDQAGDLARRARRGRRRTARGSRRTSR